MPSDDLSGGFFHALTHHQKEKNMTEENGPRPLRFQPKGDVELIDDTDTHTSYAIEGEEEDGLPTVIVRVEEADPLVVGVDNFPEKLGLPRGPLGGAWPTVCVTGNMVGPDGEPIEGSVLGRKDAMVLVPQGPAAVLDLISALLYLILDEETVDGLRTQIYEVTKANRDNRVLSMVEKQVKDYYESKGQNFERRDELAELMESGAVTVGSLEDLMKVLGGMVSDPEQLEALRQMAENADVGDIIATPVDKNDDQEDQQ